MPECPDCKSSSISSKGYREGTNTKRYVCKACGRNFSMSTKKEKVVRKEEAEKANQTLNVRISTKSALLQSKVYERETIDDIIMRLIKNNQPVGEVQYGRDSAKV